MLRTVAVLRLHPAVARVLHVAAALDSAAAQPVREHRMQQPR